MIEHPKKPGSGWLDLMRHPRNLSPEDGKLLTGLADLLALALATQCDSKDAHGTAAPLRSTSLSELTPKAPRQEPTSLFATEEYLSHCEGQGQIPLPEMFGKSNHPLPVLGLARGA